MKTAESVELPPPIYIVVDKRGKILRAYESMEDAEKYIDEVYLKDPWTHCEPVLFFPAAGVK